MNAIPAPPLKAGDFPWFNVVRPLELQDLRGKLAILDFWTYCCINCMHVIPTLKRIEKRFPETVVVIGVHSPKFPGERVTENIEQAIARYEIEHPVVHDRDLSIWKRYGIRAWPTLVFIGPDLYYLGQLPGEPDPAMLEMSVAKLLEEFNDAGSLDGQAASLLKLAAPATASALKYPGKIAFSREDNEFAVADSNHNQIITADRDGNITRRVGSGKTGHEDGDPRAAAFSRPQGLCYADGVIWVADTENHLLRKIDLSGNAVTTVAGTGCQGAPLRGQGLARRVAISSPWDVSLRDGQLYFANAGTHQIGVLNVNQGIVAAFAGTGQEALLDGPRLQSAFAQTSGLAIGDGRLFLADSETSAIRAIGLDKTGTVVTYAGTGLFDFGDRDGVGTEALYQHTLGISHADGKLYVADSYNHKIRVLDPRTRETTTLRASVNPVCGGASCSRLWEPAGAVAVDGCLYVSDTNNHRILKIDLTTEKTEIFIE
jgi:DNA-binding beta-propeller fold protein YncE